MKVTINSLAVLFCEDMDEMNGYETIVQNPKTEEIFKIDKVGYEFLRKVEGNRIYDVSEEEYRGNKEFIDLMLKEKVLTEESKYD